MMKIANAPCSWGVLEFELEGKAAGYAQVLDEMVETGYAGTELGDWGFMPTDPDELKGELACRNLAMLGAFVPVALKDEACHAAGVETAVRIAKLLTAVSGNTPFIVLADDNGSVPKRTQNAGRVTPEMGLTEAEWLTFAKGAEHVARAVKETTGLRTVFHHHCAGYVETPAELTKLLSLTDPELLGLVFDTGHYQFAGGDPVQAIHDYADRIWHMHFKDCHAEIAQQSRDEKWDYFESVNKGVFCELGQGGVDFTAVKTALETIGYEDWIVVEQDVLPGMGSPKESAARNRQFLRQIGL
ncbi:MAG: xylose isomerase [Chloroflexi bacterium]|nr:MAG: xylose isomerase [Chloroflexota bacterium]